jgi:hypothetical protein
MVVSLSAKLAFALGMIADASLSQRLTMAIQGGFFVFTGNAIPKLLRPLSSMRCDGATEQALRRFSGWTWVLTGAGFAVSWLVLPLHLAEPVSVALILGGGFAIAMRIVRLRWTARHREA